MEVVTKINPLTYGIDGLRGTLINANIFSLTTDFIVITLLAVVLLGIGSYLFERIRA